MIGAQTKTPAEQLDYDIDFADWLTDEDTISTVEATVEPADEVIVESAQISGQTVKVWLSGGEDGTTYHVTVSIATAGGRIKEDCFRLRVRGC